jgi:hypothetical protein
MIKRYAFPVGATNTPPPIPELKFTFLQGSFYSFLVNLSRPIDGNIVISRIFVDTKTVLNGNPPIGSGQRNTPWTINAGSSGALTLGVETPAGDLSTPTGHYTIYNVVVNGNPVLDGQILTIGSYSVKMTLTNI